MTRSILLVASLISALIATALAFGIYHHPTSLAHLNRITLGWLSWSVALAAAAALPVWSRR